MARDQCLELRNVVSGSAFRSLGLTSPVADFRLSLLPEALHLVLGRLLIRVDLVFVYRNRGVRLLVRGIRRKLKPPPVKTHAGDGDQEQNYHSE